jgi:hypothetical protein
MAGKCNDGVELPDHGPCPFCGAMADQQCRGRSYAEMMARAHALADARQREKEEKALQERFERQPDKRTSR